MAELNDTIDDIVAGDDYSRTETVTLPTGQTITKAWLTVKDIPGRPDNQAIVQKVVTTSYVAGQGQITNDGTGNVPAVARFDLTPTDTAALVPGDGETPYYFDFQILTSVGKINTPNAGRISAVRQITQANS